MENGETSYRRDGASRPPQRSDAQSERERALFTELPLDGVRRTPNSGRPAPVYTDLSSDAARRSARSTPAEPQRAPRAVPYTPQSRGTQPGYESYDPYARQRQPQQPQQRQNAYGGSSAAFTEISWDALRSGDYEKAEPSARRAAPAQPRVGSAGSAPESAAYRPNGNATPYRQPYATGGGSYRSETQPPRGYDADPFYGGAPQQTAPERPYGAAQHRSDYYRPGAVRRPAQRTSASRASNGGTPPRRPSSGSGNGGGGFRLPRIGKGRIHPAFYLAALVVVGLLIFGIVKLAQKNSEKPMYTLPSYAPVTATPRPSDAPQAGEATPEASAETSATPKPTAVPTPTPSGAKAKRDGDLVVPADWGATVPERAEAVYDSHFDRSCMIGNSLVEGFFMWSGMTNMRYIYGTGAVVTNVLGTLDLSPLTLNDPDYYQDIYLMFGLNEVGTDVNSFIQGYKTVIDYVREHQTKANIYVISVTPVTQEVDADPNEVQSMERINAFNSALKQFCVDNNCWYLDIYSMLVDEYGYLSADYAYAGDGKHFEKSGYVAWANYMKTHYVDENLLTE